MRHAPLNALHTFVAAARAQNLTRAAERLHLTVSALSHQIRQLEERLDCRLFVRGPRGLKLTQMGQRLLDNVAPHLEAIEEALQPLCARDDNALSLSSTPSMASSWLLPRLPGFVAQYPSIELNLDSSSDLVDFADGRYHAALRYGTGQWPGLVVEPLLEAWLTPVASPALLARRKPLHRAELGKLPLLGPRDVWEPWFAHYGGRQPVRYAASFNNSDARERAAVEGIGVALGRTIALRAQIEAGQLVTLVPERMKDAKAHYLVYPERSRAHPAFEAFRAWVLDEAAHFLATAPTGFAALRPHNRTTAPSRRRKKSP